MEAAEAVSIKRMARRLARRRRCHPWSRSERIPPGMTLDVLTTFDPISEGGRPVASGKMMPRTVLNTGGMFGAPMGSMIDTPDVSTPERALMAAVLREAVKERDVEWANDSEDESLFSVTSICDTLGVSIDSVRRAIGE